MLSHATFTEILKNEHRTSNIERPTSNNVFCQFKKRLNKTTSPDWLRRPRANLLIEILRFACFKIDKAERHQYWTFDVGCSMFDVQSVHYSGQSELHTSAAAGLKSGQPNRKRNICNEVGRATVPAGLGSSFIRQYGRYGGRPYFILFMKSTLNS